MDGHGIARCARLIQTPLKDLAAKLGVSPIDALELQIDAARKILPHVGAAAARRRRFEAHVLR